MSAICDAIELSDACSDTDCCSRAIAGVFQELSTRKDTAMALELVQAFLPRIVEVQRRHVVDLLKIYDSLVWQIKESSQC